MTSRIFNHPGMVDQILTLPEGSRYQLLAPVVRGKKGTHSKLLNIEKGYYKKLHDIQFNKKKIS